jgi:SHS2 domain-containing protein
MTARWEHFAHEADIGVRGRGATKAEAFEQAALALTAVVTDPAAVAPNEVVSINAEAPDDELLFVDWLNTLIYQMAVDKFIFSRFKVSLTDHGLHAQAWGERVDPYKHQPAVEIKGATHTSLRVAREHDEWVAQTVVDV